MYLIDTYFHSFSLLLLEVARNYQNVDAGRDLLVYHQKLISILPPKETNQLINAYIAVCLKGFLLTVIYKIFYVSLKLEEILGTAHNMVIMLYLIGILGKNNIHHKACLKPFI